MANGDGENVHNIKFKVKFLKFNKIIPSFKIYLIINLISFANKLKPTSYSEFSHFICVVREKKQPHLYVKAGRKPNFLAVYIQNNNLCC